MSYRLVNANELAMKYPEVNEMDCIYVDLPNGLDNKHHLLANSSDKTEYAVKTLISDLKERMKETNADYISMNICFDDNIDFKCMLINTNYAEEDDNE